MEPVFFADAAELRAWFLEHHADAPELLVGYHKKHTGRPTVQHTEAIEQALCFGWIDSIGRRIDDERYQVRFTPGARAACGARSTWPRSPS
ncbi:YdeI/OmpD-associated family protein [Actinoplanes sp. NPDC004185]